MSSAQKKLGDAELEIMQVIWSKEGAVTASYILKELKDRRPWQLPTLMTSLSRLGEKGFVNCDRTMGVNLYTPLVSENDYKAGASASFLQKLYNSSLRNLVATLHGNKMLGSNEIAELREFLDELESKKNKD